MTYTRLFQGQTPNHSAFILNGPEALLLSKTKGAARFIFPWVQRHELFSAACLHRSVIDISGVQTEQQLRTAAPGLADWLAERVKPTRQDAERKRSSDPRTKDKELRRYRTLADRWWQLHHRRGEMVDSLDMLRRFLVVPRYRRASAGQRHLAAFVCGMARPGDDLLAIPSGDIETFGVVSSKWLPDLLQKARVEARNIPRADPHVTSQILSLDLPLRNRREVVTIATEILLLRKDSRQLGLSIGHLYEWEGLLPLVPELYRLQEHLDAVVHKALVTSDEIGMGPLGSDIKDEVDRGEDAETFVDLCACECPAHG